MDQDEDTEPVNTDSWSQQLDLQWEKYFKQREPPTKDKVIQVDVGDQTHPKLISISENLSPMKSKTLCLLYKNI